LENICNFYQDVGDIEINDTLIKSLGFKDFEFIEKQILVKDRKVVSFIFQNIKAIF
jgi:hypothetical protein